jgi:xyloglucan-specific exo-beta-1,4-glucanase
MAEEQSMNEQAISLYPNPAKARTFTIPLPGISDNAVVRIYDNQGKMLYEKVTKGNNRIAIDARLKAGFYHVRINSNAFSFTKKLIVK